MTKMRFIDLHCDTVVCEVMGNEDSKNLRSNPTGMLDLLRMKEAGCLLQCFALYIPPMKRIASTTGEADEWDFFNDAADCYDRQIAANTDLIRPVGKYADIEKNMADGIMSSMMTIENGEPLNGKIERLDEMYRRGVRLITLTHNQENTLGYPNCLEPDAGLKPFGIEAVRRMNELGITGAKQGDYEARFTFYDQGYSRIQPSLEALSGTAELLLILSSSLLVIAALLLAFFYAQSQKQSIGTMRLLGCSKARAFVAVMLSALIIAVTGALIGAAIGHALTASVGESIMANANQTPEEFLAFSAYLAESTQVEVEFALGADAKVSLLTCLAALGLFIAGTLVFMLRYLGKGPRELLPRAGE